MNVRWEDERSLEDGQRGRAPRTYNHPDNKLRASVLADPAGKRSQHEKGQHPGGDLHVEIVPGDRST